MLGPTALLLCVATALPESPTKEGQQQGNQRHVVSQNVLIGQSQLWACTILPPPLGPLDSALTSECSVACMLCSLSTAGSARLCFGSGWRSSRTRRTTPGAGRGQQSVSALQPGTCRRHRSSRCCCRSPCGHLCWNKCSSWPRCCCWWCWQWRGCVRADHPRGAPRPAPGPGTAGSPATSNSSSAAPCSPSAHTSWARPRTSAARAAEGHSTGASSSSSAGAVCAAKGPGQQPQAS